MHMPIAVNGLIRRTNSRGTTRALATGDPAVGSRTPKYSESHVRSLLKAVSWRLVGTVATSAIVWTVTRRPFVTLAIVGVDVVAKTGLYWAHERVWNRVRAGRREPRPAVIWLTGLSGAGKTTLAEGLANQLRGRGYKVEHIDGDTVRTFFPMTGFSRSERDEHVRRVGYLAARLEQHGVVVIASLISPYLATRAFVRALCTNFVEVYVSTPLQECERRDVKGLYGRARRGEVASFTGVSDPYEAPVDAEIVVDTYGIPLSDATGSVLRQLHRYLGESVD